MPLNVDNLIQINSGSFEGTSGTVSLPGVSTADNTIIIAAGVGGNGAGTFSGAPADTAFKKASSGTQGTRLGHPYVFLKASSPGGEQDFTFTVTGGSQQVCWAIFEATNLDATEEYIEGSGVPGALDQSSTVPISNPNVAVSSQTVGPFSGSVISYSSMVMAVFFATNTTPTAPTIGDPSDGFVTVATASVANGSRAHALTVAVASSLSLVNYQSTATITPDSQFYATMVAFTAIDAKHAPLPDAISGFEIGTATGLTSLGIAVGDGPPPWDASAGSPTIISSDARTGSYCLELSSVAAIENVGWTAPASPAPQGNLNKGFGNGPVMAVDIFYVKFPTALPLTDVELAWYEVSPSGITATLWYRAATQKLGMKVGTGTEVGSDATVAANKWIGINTLYDPRTSAHQMSWAVDYDSLDAASGPIVQSAASGTGMTAGRVTGAYLGWPTARTATVRYDDRFLCRTRKAFPLGRVNVRPLKVDPAGTPTISGTTANFEVYTSNGTGSAWNAANARNAVDDIPPTIGATDDGVMQVNVATADYVEFPMETFVAAPDHVLRAARWYWAPWAGSGNPAACRFDILDGSLTRTIDFTADHGADDTALFWLGGIHRGPSATTFYLLDQAKVDGFKCRWGFSNDANPDTGIRSMLIELVTQPATVIGVLSGEGGAFRVYVRQDPNSSAVASYLGTTPAGTRGMTMYGTIDGVDWSQYIGPNTTYEKLIGASDIGQVTAIGMTPDPTE